MYAYVDRAANGDLKQIIMCDEKPSGLAMKDPLQIELDRYFKGELKTFNTQVTIPGTAFQRAVYEVTLTIPYGQTRSYGDVAKLIGNPKAARAVGQALNKNPYPILIPCHRVIGHDQRLVGFGQKLSYKQTLLDLERSS